MFIFEETPFVGSILLCRDVPWYEAWVFSMLCHYMVSMIVTMVIDTMHDKFAQRTEIYKSSKIQLFAEGQLTASVHSALHAICNVTHPRSPFDLLVSQCPFR